MLKDEDEEDVVCEIGARVVWVTLCLSPHQASVSSDVWSSTHGQLARRRRQGLEAAEQVRTPVQFHRKAPCKVT